MNKTLPTIGASWLFCLAIFASAEPPQETKQLTQCSLKGAAVESGKRQGGSQDLGRVIRMFFDASDWEDCRQMVTLYCKQDIVKVGFEPKNLEGEFIPNSGNPTLSKKTFSVLRNCRVSVKDEPKKP